MKPPQHLASKDGATVLVIGAVIAPVVGMAAALLLPAKLGDAVAALADGRDLTESALRLGAVLMVAAASSVVATFTTGAYVATVTARVRRQVASAAILDPQPLGAADLVTRLLVDSRQPASLLPMATSVVLAAVTACCGLVLLGRVDWVLLVGVLTGLVVIVLLLRRLVDDLSTLLQDYRGAQSEVGQRLIDAQAGAVTIRSAGTWRQEVRRILAPMPALRDAGEALWAAQRRFAWRSSVFVPAMLLVTVAAGGWSLTTGRIDVGGYVAAIGYTYLILGGLDGVEAAAGLGAVRASRARLEGLLTDPRGRTPTPVLRPPARGSDRDPLDVVLEDVTVTGTDDQLVLDHVSLTIPAGAFVAITGASGSGRSTLAAVIAGVKLPSSGSAQVGGEPAHQSFGPGGFRRAVLGHARPAMLGDDLDGLISLGVGRSDPKTIRNAARQAHIIDVVDALPLGFSTPISDLPLSGGELQRLALAQALARDTGLLVLDDVTSSLDPATEREVISALLAARGHRTLVVVTNREAVLSRADRVVHLGARTPPSFVAAGAPR